MKKLLILFVIAVILLFASNLALAEVDVRGLTPAQQAELTIHAEKMKANGSVQAPSTTNLEIASKWAEAGKGLAIGLGAGAKELNVAVNEFAETRVGKMTTYIIVWKLMGRDIIALSTGALMFLSILPLWWVFKAAITKRVEYEDKVWAFGFTTRKVKSVQYRGDEGFAIPAIAVAVMAAVIFCNALRILPF